MASQEMVQDVIRTKRFEIVDENNVARGIISLHPSDGNPQFTLTGSLGEGRIVIGFDGIGAHISILDDEGKGVINLRSFNDGRRAISISQLEKVIFSAGVDINEKPFLDSAQQAGAGGMTQNVTK